MGRGLKTASRTYKYDKEMKKIFVYGLSAVLLLGSCTSSEQLGGAAAGGLIGGIFGSAVGGLMGGPRGSDAGVVIGMVSGAALGAAATSPELREERRSQYDYTSDQYNRRSEVIYSSHSDEARELGREYSNLEVNNLRFIDINNNRAIDAGENCKIAFEIRNKGNHTVYDIAPVLAVSGSKSIVISPTAVIGEIAPGKSVRYTAEVYADKKLRDGRVEFSITFAKRNYRYLMSTFELNTQAKIKKKYR